jgi:hypothetical protein
MAAAAERVDTLDPRANPDLLGHDEAEIRSRAMS